MPKHSNKVRVACAMLAGLLLAVALLLNSCSDPPPNTQQSKPMSEINAPAIAQANSQQAPATEPPPAAASEPRRSTPDIAANRESASVDAAHAREITPEHEDATPEAEEPATEPNGLELTLPAVAGPVNLYAGPDDDWAVRRVIQPTESLVVLGRASRQWYSRGITWLQVELSDGVVGWLQAEHLMLNPVQLRGLPRFHPLEMTELVVIRSNVYVHQRPDVTSPGCRTPSTTKAAIGGLSPDGQWFALDFGGGVCADPAGDWVGEGWALAAEIDPAAMLAERPVVLPEGRWVISIDPQLRPIGQPEEDNSQAWWELATAGEDVKFLMSPTGEYVLAAASRGHSEYGDVLSIISRDGERTEIGTLYLSSPSERTYRFNNHVHWSPDGRAIIVNDLPNVTQFDADASYFWLYDLDAERSIDLRQADGVAGVYYDARFHHDGGSIYATKVEPQRGKLTLVRLTLTGDDWPNFAPIPIAPGWDHFFSGWKNLILTTKQGAGLLWTEQGEPLGERSGSRFHLLPDGERFAYYADGEFVIEQFSTGAQVRLSLALWLFNSELPYWSFDGRYFAVLVYPPAWQNRLRLPWEKEQLRVYDLRGEPVRVYRVVGCAEIEWLVDQPRLVVANSLQRCIRGP